MMALLIIFITNLFFLQHTIAVTQINGTWNDDFTGYMENGWFGESTQTNNSFHGPYYDDTYHLIRYFTCSQDSIILIQYKILQCDGNKNGDQYVSLFLDGSTLSTTFANIPKTLFTDDQLTEEFECASNWMQTTINIGDGRVQFMVNKYTAFKVEFTIHSNNNTYLALSDIQMQCKPLSTIYEAIGPVQSSSTTVDMIFSHLNITVAIIIIFVISFCFICIPCFCLLDFYYTRKQKQKKKLINQKNSIILSKSNFANVLTSPGSNSGTSETVYKNSPLYLSSPNSSNTTEISTQMSQSPIYGTQLNSIQNIIKEDVPSPIHNLVPSPIHNLAVGIPIMRNINSPTHSHNSPVGIAIHRNEYSFKNKQQYYHPSNNNQMIAQISSATASPLPQVRHYNFNNINNNQFPNTFPINQLYGYKTVSRPTMKSISSATPTTVTTQNISNIKKEEKNNNNEVSKSVSECSTCSTSSQNSNSSHSSNNSNSIKSTESKSIDMNQLMDRNDMDESVVSFVREPSDKTKDHSISIKV